MRPSNNNQKMLIHQLVHILGIARDVYKEMLLNNYNVDSSKDLSFQQAGELIKTLKKDAIAAGVWENKKSFQKHKYNNMADREGMASPKQLRMIEAMWADYSVMPDAESRAKALRAFLANRFGVSDVKFIDKPTASRIIYALDKMVGQQKKSDAPESILRGVSSSGVHKVS